MPRLPQPFARSVVAAALSLLFVSGLVEHAMRGAGLPVAAGVAWAKDGGGSSDGSGSSGGGGGGSSGSSGSSGSGSGSSGSSGSGSGGSSHDSSSHDGVNPDSSSHGGDRQSDDGGRGQGLGSSTGGGSGRADGGASRSEVTRFLETLKTRGEVVASSRRDGIWVRYSDGWTERVSAGRYALIDPRRRVVIERAGRRSDVRRLDAAIESGPRN